MTVEASVDPLDNSQIFLIMSMDALTVLSIPRRYSTAISQTIKLKCVQKNGECKVHVQNVKGMIRVQEGSISLAIGTDIEESWEYITVKGSMAGALGASGQGSVSGEDWKFLFLTPLGHGHS